MKKTDSGKIVFFICGYFIIATLLAVGVGLILKPLINSDNDKAPVVIKICSDKNHYGFTVGELVETENIKPLFLWRDKIHMAEKK
ncbi:MAG: hypothetical protein GY821_12515 [Gammaproteobacteria bacterium]|nr:hypothetical protein [Gammaproteobacteria bacterium]